MFFRTSDPVTDQLVAHGLSRHAAAKLSSDGTLLDLPEGTTLCTKGEHGRQAFLLVRGEAAVHTANGRITVGPGEVIGEIAVLDPSRRRNADVVATSDISVLVFDPGTFWSLAGAEDLHPVLAPVRTAA